MLKTWPIQTCVLLVVGMLLIFTLLLHESHIHVFGRDQFTDSHQHKREPQACQSCGQHPRHPNTNNVSISHQQVNFSMKQITKATPISFVDVFGTNYKRKFPLLMSLKGLHTGRLGNQMFMYASLLGISRSLNRQPFISPGFFLDVPFKLSHVTEIPGTEKWPTISSRHFAHFDQRLLNTLKGRKFLHRNLTLGGYLQSWKYFQNVTQDIRKEFTFRSSFVRRSERILKKLLPQPRKELVLVGVHVRRSDLLDSSNIAKGYTVAPRSYFLKAFSLMRRHFPAQRVVFLVSTDDLAWCQENLNMYGVIFSPDVKPEVHMSLMASCDHVIMSTGTFSWWAAWLAGGHVVYYNNFPAAGSSLSRGFSKEDFFPNTWVGLGD